MDHHSIGIVFLPMKAVMIHLLTSDVRQVLQRILHINVHSGRGGWKWKASVLPRTGSNFESYWNQYNSIFLIPGVMTFSTPKLAVAYLLMRLLNPSKWQRRILGFLSVSCIVFAALCAVFLFAQCSPVKGLWDPVLKPVCWKPSVLINWTIFAGGSLFSNYGLCSY